MTKEYESLLKSYSLLHEQLLHDLKTGKITKEKHDQLHAKCWDDLENELKSRGFLIEAKTPSLEGRIERLEKLIL